MNFLVDVAQTPPSGSAAPDLSINVAQTPNLGPEVTDLTTCDNRSALANTIDDSLPLDPPDYRLSISTSPFVRDS